MEFVVSHQKQENELYEFSKDHRINKNIPIFHNPEISTTISIHYFLKYSIYK